MKKYIWFISLVFLAMAGLSCAPAQEPRTEDAMAAIQRFADGRARNVELHLDDSGKEENDWFRTEVRDGMLHITGNTNLALCRGFYEFVKDNDLGMFCWNGKRLELPDSWEGCTVGQKASPFALHYYMNVCTFGYSTPYWDWDRWEKEIDWMAFHGINMPLALVANEAITARVWKKLGMTEEEINDYFCGPAHLPWMRMGNISHHDGPLSEAWHESQIRLQHKILDRMRAMGMHPICPAFAGFVPKTITRLYPDLQLAETLWGQRFKNWMIDPKDPLFFEIGKMFIEEWEKEFGKCEYYLADSFNEMEIPFPPVGTEERYDMLRLYGDRLYQSIHAGNPDAVWVMQGWMFGYDRDIWEPRTLEALLENVPDDGIILLDLAANYNKYEWKNEFDWDYYQGFYNTTWIYSVIPNMGGKSTVSGCLDFFANNHLVPMASPNRGHLCGHGMAPEGIESNEVVFELITDAGWSDQEIDVDAWLADYSCDRYGFDDIRYGKIWEEMQKTVYSGYVSHPRFNWMYRPGSVRNGSVKVNEHLDAALQELIAVAAEHPRNELMAADAIEWAALCAGQKMEILLNKVQDELFEGKPEAARRHFADFKELALKTDRLLTSHPNHRAERWVEYARKAGTTPEEKDHYESNAKRIITVWGPPVEDYASRLWSGVLRDYYVPRWEKWFESRMAGEFPELSPWEVSWVEKSHGFSEVESYPEVWEGIADVAASAAAVPYDLIADDGSVAGEWYFNYKEPKVRHLNFTVGPEQLQKMKGVELVQVPGSAPLKVQAIQIRMDGKLVNDIKFEGKRQKQVGKVLFRLGGNENGNNGCSIRIVAETQGETSGRVLLIF